MHFTKKEIRDLFLSTILLAVIFARFNFEIFLEVLFVIVIVFISHEVIGHKYLAQRYGFGAEYKIWPMGIFLGLITGLIGGIVFAAPGAVYISEIRRGFAFSVSKLTRSTYGKISAGGPAVNIALGWALAVITVFYPLSIIKLASTVSFFLAGFNMIPIMPLDGAKVMAWSRKVWLLLIILAVVGYIFLNNQYLLLLS